MATKPPSDNLPLADGLRAAMRQKLAREPFAEKIRKVAQLIRLAKTFPRRQQDRDKLRQPAPPPQMDIFAG